MNILRMVSLQTFAMGVTGVTFGTLVSVVASPWIGRLLFGVSSPDATMLCAVAIFVALTAAIATALPAVRAVAVDPAVALRQEN